MAYLNSGIISSFHNELYKIDEKLIGTGIQLRQSLYWYKPEYTYSCDICDAKFIGKLWKNYLLEHLLIKEKNNIEILEENKVTYKYYIRRKDDAIGEDEDE
jgi:hypothetical protein